MLSLHPNGFIQYDLPYGKRLHIWHPDLPLAQEVYTPIHDHTFSFHSRIVLGRLTHVEYEFERDVSGDYLLHGAVRDGDLDTKLVPMGMVGHMTAIRQLTLSVGYEYTFRYGRFHTSEGSRLTATIMEKTSTNDTPFPRIAVPVGTPPDNNFRRQEVDIALLQQYVDRVLEEIGHNGQYS